MAVISKLYTKILAALLAWLGFSGTVVSCNGIGGYGGDEYGVPSATFKVRGVVVSEKDDTPIQGISVSFSEKRKYYDSSEEYYNKIYSTLTSKSGNFNISRSSFPDKKLYYVELTDIDGDENGLFTYKIVEADFRNVTFTGGSGNWNEGQAEIDLGTIKLTPDENISE